MDDRRRTLAAVTILVGFFLFVAIVIGVLVTGKKIVSPVPDENAIRIIFVTPTPAGQSPLDGAPSPTLTP